MPTTAVALPAHAKVNLHLRVERRRPDGMHELHTHFQALALHDLLLAEPAIRTSLEGGHEDDLVLRALSALEAWAGRAMPTRLRLVKRIPAGSGLGGGSSDGAAAVRLLARLHRVDADLALIASELGADVPFFLRGGAAVGTGRGEHLQPVATIPGWFALAWPGFSVSTAAVYAAWDRLGGEGRNELQRAAFAIEPRLCTFAAQLRARDSRWLMTGSGAAFFLHTPSSAEAERAVRGLDCWTAVTRPVGRWAGR
jgi:4-diphosphocytidyl-2-C-methyl-D-erythritol kinase